MAVLIAAPQAHALQLTNRDTAEHKIAVTEKTATQDIVVKPSQVIEGLCPTGCTMKMADGEEYEFDGNEVVSIEEGLMFLDEPSDGTTDNSDTGTPPPDAATVEPDGAPKKNP
ncbi:MULTISPECIES: hypothetical protein [Rhodomicrobium]|uniref:hypothetical protein n=1 Tax=Rhodomicrobium TaxID=1068 RepID=UPI000B4B17A3|nr:MULTISPECIES: hypothetical protein [Rhodomicrobium]